jgi:hypothetical protein
VTHPIKKKNNKKSRAIAQTIARVQPGAPAVDQVNPEEAKKKIAFLNKMLTKKPAETDSRLLRKLREEVATQNKLQQDFAQLQANLQSNQGRVNAVADLLWEEHNDDTREATSAEV